MANASKFLDKRFKLIGDTYRVRIRITHLRKSIYINTKYSFDEDTYNKKIVLGKNMNNNENLQRAKKEIESLESKALEVIDNLPVFTFQEFKARFDQKGDRSDLINLLRQYSISLKAEGKFSNSSIYNYAADLFERYSLHKFGRNYLNINQVTPGELKNFELWAQSKSDTKRSYSITTISMYLVRVQKIFNDLIGSGELKKSLYPFGAKLYQIPSSINYKRPLSIDEIMMLANYMPTSQVEDFAKSMFMFSYLASGANMADVFNLKKSDINDDRITFIRQKTKGKGKAKELSIKIIPEMQAIIDNHKVNILNSEYLFKVYTNNMTEQEKHRAKDIAIAYINRSLKQIAKKIGLPEGISSYWARHSYSNILMNSGAPTAYISKRLGHSNIATTEAYLSHFSKENEEQFESNLLNYNK